MILNAPYPPPDLLHPMAEKIQILPSASPQKEAPAETPVTKEQEQPATPAQPQPVATPTPEPTPTGTNEAPKPTA